jgi:hypothetical protein
MFQIAFTILLDCHHFGCRFVPSSSHLCICTKRALSPSLYATLLLSFFSRHFEQCFIATNSRLVTLHHGSTHNGTPQAPTHVFSLANDLCHGFLSATEHNTTRGSSSQAWNICNIDIALLQPPFGATSLHWQWRRLQKSNDNATFKTWLPMGCRRATTMQHSKLDCQWVVEGQQQCNLRLKSRVTITLWNFLRCVHFLGWHALLDFGNCLHRGNKSDAFVQGLLHYPFVYFILNNCVPCNQILSIEQDSWIVMNLWGALWEQIVSEDDLVHGHLL